MNVLARVWAALWRTKGRIFWFALTAWAVRIILRRRLRRLTTYAGNGSSSGGGSIDPPGRLFVGRANVHQENQSQGSQSQIRDDNDVNLTTTEMSPAFSVLNGMRGGNDQSEHGVFDWSFRPDLGLFSALFSLFPPDWGRNLGHVQTIQGVRRRPPQMAKNAAAGVPFVRQHITLCDGAQVALDWLDLDKFFGGSATTANFKGGGDDENVDVSACTEEERPVLVVLHGICGGSAELYVQHLMVESTRVRLPSGHDGFRPVCFNYRGANDTDLHHPYGYSAGQTHDVRDVMRAVHRRYPRAPITACGFSLGANILAKFLGEEGGLFHDSHSHVSPVTTALLSQQQQLQQQSGDNGDNSGDCQHDSDVSYREFIAGATVVSNLFDLHVCSDFLEGRAAGRLYSRKIASGLLDYVRRHAHVLRTSNSGNEEDGEGDGEGEDGNNNSIDSHTAARSAIRRSVSASYDVDAVLRETESVRQFDELATRRMFGFDSVEHYYECCSSSKFLSHVAVPLLCISAEDDPLIPIEACPLSSMVEIAWPSSSSNSASGSVASREPSHNTNNNASPAAAPPVSECVALALTRTGGHVGWIEKDDDCTWSDRTTLSFLSSSLRRWYGEQRAK
jgi:predicted alpha/beta-fold hydrolase